MTVPSAESDRATREVPVPGADSGRERAAPTIVALVLHARSVPSLAREAFADEARAFAESETAVLVRTCHRVELYLAPPRAESETAGHQDGLPAGLPAIPPGTRRIEDADAVRHLIEVACGLDSAVFGEDQILHQLRTLLHERRAAGALSPILDRLFQSALRAGRQAHAWFDGSPRSLADVALDRIAALSGDLAGRNVLVVGAGRMGRLAAFAVRRRAAHPVIANRTDERARALAAETGGVAVPFAADDTLPEIAGAIVALGGPWRPGTRDAARILAARTPIADLSSPPSVAVDLQSALGDRFTSVDDLVVGPEFAPHDRLRRKVEGLVAEQGREYCQWLRTRDAVPVIQAVAASAEQVRLAELDWLLRRLPALDVDQRAAVEQMSHRLVAALLHAPLSALNSDDAGMLEGPARDLFGL